ncbi:ATP-binding protein [Pseudoalteromonas fenneropenaei]|uniref:histidine kinase n=1 Tax=Pseudoalteromonas fenneropenaei TaxID=1737459 RepID=A0ABV7CJC8_9GAMM
MSLPECDFAILQLDDKDNIVYANPSAQQLLLPGDNFSELHALHDYFRSEHKADIQLFAKSPNVKSLIAKTCFGKTLVLAKSTNPSKRQLLLSEIDLRFDKDLSLLIKTLNNSNLGVWQVDKTFSYAYFSKACNRMLGIEATRNLTWHGFINHIHEEDRDLLICFVESHVNSDTLLKFEFRVPTMRGVKWMQLVGDKYATLNGEVMICGTLRDFTSEKQVLIELNEANEHRRLALEAGRIGTWNAIKTQTDWVWDWDRQASEIFALNPFDTGDLRVWAKTIHPEDAPRVFAALEESISNGTDFEQSYRAILFNGEQIFVYAKGICHHDLHGNPVRISGVCIDQSTSRRKEVELTKVNSELEKRVSARTRELVEALARAEQASHSKSDFLAMMSHELRTPMNAIIGSLDLLAMKPFARETRELIETANISANNLIMILNDILDINKIEAGKLELDSFDFDVSEVINNIIVIFDPLAEAKGVKFTLQETSQLPKSVNGDGNRIRQILFNLVSNAIKFSSGLKRIGKVHIKVGWEQFDNDIAKLVVTVRDNGIGIDDNTRKRLFTPFIQAEKSTTRKYGGTGLGLAISGRLLDLMGGEVLLQSAPDQGSEFTVKIPIFHFQPRQSDFLMEKVKLYADIDLGHCESVTNKLGYMVQTIEPGFFPDVDDHVPSVIIVTCDASADSLLASNCTLDCGALILFEDIDCQELQKQFSKAIFLKLNTLNRFTLRKALLDLSNADFDITDFDFTSGLKALEDLDESEAPTQITKSILLVEDNPFNQKLMNKQINKLGYACDLASNGEQGFEKWRKNNYQLVLTDCHMPELDGYQMTERIRKFETDHALPRTPIIAVTGAAMKGDEEYCKSFGMDDFISKPIKLDKLKTTLARWHNDA